MSLYIQQCISCRGERALENGICKYASVRCAIDDSIRDIGWFLRIASVSRNLTKIEEKRINRLQCIYVCVHFFIKVFNFYKNWWLDTFISYGHRSIWSRFSISWLPFGFFLINRAYNLFSLFIQFIRKKIITLRQWLFAGFQSETYRKTNRRLAQTGHWRHQFTLQYSTTMGPNASQKSRLHHNSGNGPSHPKTRGNNLIRVINWFK